MNTVTSDGGTSIAYDQSGDGPPVILVNGALGTRSDQPMGPLATALELQFTVYTYDRRGPALTSFRVELGHLDGTLHLCVRCSPRGPATYWTRDLDEHVIE